jgi:quercetin dioxygenase-like cupin family protein
MIVTKLKDMKGGWFIGNFIPASYVDIFEVGIKEYKKGEKGGAHHHKLSKEFTVILSGLLMLNESVFEAGDIVQINEFESVSFECIEDCLTVVVKNKSVKGDKYYD